jgi:hypothetical protein
VPQSLDTSSSTGSSSSSSSDDSCEAVSTSTSGSSQKAPGRARTVSLLTPTAAGLPAAAPSDSRLREPAPPRHSCRARMEPAVLRAAPSPRAGTRAQDRLD